MILLKLILINIVFIYMLIAIFEAVSLVCMPEYVVVWVGVLLPLIITRQVLLRLFLLFFRGFADILPWTSHKVGLVFVARHSAEVALESDYVVWIQKAIPILFTLRLLPRQPKTWILKRRFTLGLFFFFSN